MRALGAVLADLADIGFDAAWCGLQAADVGAAHGRFRVFILAWPTADTEHDGRNGASVGRGTGAGETVWGVLEPQGSPSDPGLTLLPTPMTGGGMIHAGGNLTLEGVFEGVTPRDIERHKQAGRRVRIEDILPAARMRGGEVELLPTPTTADHGADAPGRTGAPSLSTDFVTNLLPTPLSPMRDGEAETLGDALSGRRKAGGDFTTGADTWGDYADAIARWESVLGRPAPSPTEPGPKGNPRLSPIFVEWLMGLPAGHVTDPAIGLSRNQQLKALGNGVVPQQGAAALEWLLSVVAVTA